MVRPKKPRHFDGVELADNLYPDPKKRKGRWQYIKPDGSKKGFIADTVHEANQIAKEANTKRADHQGITKPPVAKGEKKLTLIGVLVEDYIVYREKQDPKLKGARSWKNRYYALRQFGREFTMPPSKLNMRHINAWWEGLTHYQQKLRHAEFRKAFNYWRGRGLFKHMSYNPFTTADDQPRLYVRTQPQRKRLRLKINEFWQVYEKAGELGYEGLQVAMGLSLLTFMREGDVLNLRIDKQLNEHSLKATIGKSLAQRGHTKATRLEWDTRTHSELRKVITKGKALSLKNMRSPYLVSYISTRRDRNYKSRLKKHKGQMTKERLCEQFRAACDATELWVNIPKDRTPPTFHEVRSLADALAIEAGFETTEIQEVMAHSEESETLKYAAEHDLPHMMVDIKFTAEMLNGEF